jgi:serine protease Do
VIVGFGDQAIKNTHELALAVGNTHPGQSIPVKLLRDSKEQTIAVAIDTLKHGKNGGMPEPSESEQGGLGLNLAPLDKNTREQLGLAGSTQGAVVAGVKPDSPAEQRGIQTGDLIVRIDSTKVESPADAAEAVRKATKAGKKAVLVQINRDGNTALIPVPLKGDG